MRDLYERLDEAYKRTLRAHPTIFFLIWSAFCAGMSATAFRHWYVSPIFPFLTAAFAISWLVGCGIMVIDMCQPPRK